MAETESAWTYDKPLSPGWYAVVKCWEPSEGYFPDANFWDGQSWQERQPILQRSPVSFDTQVAARAWADAHDLGM